MAGMRYNKNNSLPLGRWHGLFVPLTCATLVPYLKARFKMVCRFYQPFRRTHRHGCMAGYHCLMPTAFRPMQHNPYLTSCGISFIATPYPIFRIPRCEIYHQSLFLVAINPQFIGILSKKREQYKIWPIVHWKCTRTQAGVKWSGTPA